MIKNKGAGGASAGPEGNAGGGEATSPKYVRALEYDGRLFRTEKELGAYKLKEKFGQYIRGLHGPGGYSGMSQYEYGMLLVCEEPTLSAFIQLLRDSGLLYEWVESSDMGRAGGNSSK